MFHGLDSIDWASFNGHIAFIGKPQEIPKWIHDLLSPNPKVRQRAADWLFGMQQHTGMVVATTPYIIPFALEVLIVQAYPEKPYILEKLFSVARYNLIMGRNIRLVRLALHTHDELIKGLPLYLQLLNNDEIAVRFYTARLLHCCQEQATQVLEAFMQRYERELNVRVRIAILRSASELIRDAYLQYSDASKSCRDFIESKLSGRLDLIERFAAAEALLTMKSHVSQEISQMIEAVEREFSDRYTKTPFHYGYDVFEFDPLALDC